MSWSEQEKRDLLLGLEKHGPNNLEEIQKYLPHRSVTEIRSTIQKYKQMAQSKSHLSEEKEDPPPLDQWIKIIKSLQTNNQDVDNIYSRLFKYIALFADHSSDSNVNLSDCYFVISELMKGESIKILDPYTAEFLSKCLSNLAHKIDNMDKTENFKFVKSIDDMDSLTKTMVRSYSKKQEDFTNNPLKIPKSLLKMPQDEPGPSTSSEQ